MLRRQKQIYAQISKLVDALLFGLGFWLAHCLRSQYNPPVFRIFGGSDFIAPFESYMWLLLILLPAGPIFLSWQGYYSRPLLSSRKQSAWMTFQGCAWGTVALIIVMFLARQQLARSVIFLTGIIAWWLLLGKEVITHWWLRTEWGREQFQRRFILVGSVEDNRRFIADLRRQAPDQIAILAQLDVNTAPIEKLVDLMHEHSANGVILNARHTFFGKIEKAIQLCELEGVEAWLMADFFKTHISHTMLDDFASRPMLVFRSAPGESWGAVIKQGMDYVGAAVLLALLSFPMLATALIIKLTSPGPILFRQQRSGLNGRPFTMLKFRSMATNAEQRKHELAALNEMSGPVFKITNDPRITPVGRFIRRYSIDEFPQLFNVLRGEMSLVGPRPLPVDETKRFDEISHRRRLSVKPGLTCLWQVSGRNQVKDFKEWVRLDLEYIDNWSLWLDFKILLRTIPAVFTGTGAK